MSGLARKIPASKAKLPALEAGALYVDLVDRYWRSVFMFAWGMVGDRQAAEDITQEAYSSALAGLAGLREPERAASWLFSIAANAARRHLRDGQRWVDQQPNVSSAHGSTDMGLAVREILDALSEDDREILLLVAHHGYGPAEAGEILSISADAAYKRWSRARRRFRQAYDGAIG